MQELAETQREAAQVVELLDLRQGGLAQTLDERLPGAAHERDGRARAACSPPCRCPPPTTHSKAACEMRQYSCSLG